MADTKISALTSLTTPSSDDVIPIVDDPAGTPVTKKITVANLLSGGLRQGTSFPSSPTLYDRFFRTDRLIDYFWAGSIWLSVTLYDLSFLGQVGLLPIAATSTPLMADAPWAGVYDLYMIDAYASFYVSGGTALSGSHKWVITINKQPAASAVSVLTINSGASDAYRTTGANVVNALLGTTNNQFWVDVVKTGTPGNIYVLPRITYRLVG